MLKDAIVACEKINERRGYVILKAFGVVKELQGLKFFRNSTMITKEELDSHFRTMKTSLSNNFDNLMEFLKKNLNSGLSHLLMTTKTTCHPSTNSRWNAKK
jgi:hypothetical protein